ncbi:putative nuclease HARBI1 [Ixodes scapularis]
MTPIRAPKDQPELDYNEALTKTRQVIERTFGLLKSRFRCLDKSGGFLQYRPKICCKIIVACVVLHNYCMRHHVSLNEPLVGLSYDEEEEEEEEEETPTPAPRTRRARPMVAGAAARSAVVRHSFT